MISVIIATYNGEKYILAQLESILNQTLVPDEVIIRDDCSKDNTVHLIKKFIVDHNLNNWKLKVNKENRGFVKNFYQALSEANGDFIFLCDQDDIWLSNKIEELSKLMIKSGALMIHSNIDVIDENGNIIAYNYEIQKKGFRNVYLSEYLRTFHYCGMSSVMSAELRKYCLKLSPERIPTHDWFWGVIASCCNKFFITDTVYSLRRFHSSNVAMSMNNKTIRMGKLQRIHIIKESELFYNTSLEVAKLFFDDNRILSTIQNFLTVAKKRSRIVENRDIRSAILMGYRLYYYPTIKSYLGDLLYIIGVF